MFAFDLTPDLSESDSTPVPHHGTLGIKVSFAEALPHTVIAVIYAEFDNVLTIDKARQIGKDYS